MLSHLSANNSLSFVVVMYEYQYLIEMWPCSLCEACLSIYYTAVPSTILSLTCVFTGKASPPGVPVADKVGRNYIDLSWSKPRSDGGSKIKGKLLFWGTNKKHLIMYYNGVMRLLVRQSQDTLPKWLIAVIKNQKLFIQHIGHRN